MKGAFKLDNICNRLQPTDKEGSSDDMEAGKMQPVEENTETVPTVSEESSAGRKNRRKSRKPINIVRCQKEVQQEYFEDLDEYKIANKDIDVLDENENIADQTVPEQPSSISEYANSSRFDDIDKGLVDGSFSIDSSGALDLSVVKHDDDVDDELESEPVVTVTPIPLPVSPTPRVLPVSSQVVQAACQSASNHVASPKKSENSLPSKEPNKNRPPQEELNNYAESTMHELLSMYGLQGETEAAKLGLKVPALSQALMMQHQLMISQQQQQNLAAAAAAAVPVKKEPAVAVQITPKKEPTYNKIVENVNKLAALPADLLIGNPRLAPPGAKSAVLQARLLASMLQQRRSHLAAQQQPVPDSPYSSVPEGANKSALDKFTTSSDYIKACFIPGSTPKPTTINTSGGKLLLPDYSKYLKRFESYEECRNQHCKDMNFREHFHCMDCNYRVFVKKEEMIRHFKWHRKRDDSLQHGFMRYSPMDDCTNKFGTCTHNGRQTHYHCMQSGCNKVYISTSDVQMHANYHRKDSAIIQEGFQRFRATEDCGTVTCAFYGQRTTHFHCRRNSCAFTFKNKADMEKHKTYHQKDELLARDGFKKFMKYEHCSYDGCRYSKVANHIHCIRPGCNYVLHSTGQLFSHKRKHERREYETAYKRYKDDGVPTMVVPPSADAGHSSMSTSNSNDNNQEFVDLDDLSKLDDSNHSSDTGLTPIEIKPELGYDVEMDSEHGQAHPTTLAKLANKLSAGQGLGDSLNLPIPDSESNISLDEGTVTECATPVNREHLTVTTSGNNTQPTPGGSKQMMSTPTVPPIMEKRERDESWKKYLTRYTANDPCHSRCQFLYKDHYHCNSEECGQLFRSKDGVREHAKYHEQQQKVSQVWYSEVSANEDCDTNGCQHNQEHHYHCLWTGCNTVVTDKTSPFSRLEHHRIHEFSRNMVMKGNKMGLSRSLDSKRRRGRPPKYPKENIPMVPKDELIDTEIQEEVIHLRSTNCHAAADILETHGFKSYDQTDPCPDDKCSLNHKEHYHCVRPRCYHACDRTDVLKLHSHDFHNFINILEGFEFFDRSVNCRRPHCQNNHSNRHFHCVRPRCDYAFVRYSTMHQHDKKHRLAELEEKSGQQLGQHQVQQLSTQGAYILPKQEATEGVEPGTIKAAGTFYPISTIPKLEVSASGTEAGVPIVGMRAVPITSSHIILNSTGGPVVLNSNAGPVVAQIPMVQNLAGPIAVPMAILPTQVATGMASSGLVPLLQVKGTTAPQLHWSEFVKKMHYGINQNCGRPFCKLKKKDHFHCYECNQAMSDPERLKIHVCSKHGLRMNQSEMVQGNPVAKLPQETMPMSSQDHDGFNGEEDHMDESGEEIVYDDEAVGENEEYKYTNISSKQQNGKSTESKQEEKSESSSFDSEDEPLYNLSTRSEESTPRTIDNHQSRDPGLTDSLSESNSEDTPNLSGSISRRSGRKRIATKHDDFIDSDQAVTKQRRLSSASKASKEEIVPEGYNKYKYYEDCQVEKCSYRLNASHYHCIRKECQYGFSDRLRILTHNQKHERMDSVMGDDFQQFRVSQDCARPDCEHENKYSHFHCLRCAFICTDANKVLAHRRQHNKTDSITAQGFQKYAGTSDCFILTCNYYKKQTHYHCTVANCKVAVLGPSQMGVHRQKHMAGVTSGVEGQITIMPNIASPSVTT